QAVIALDNFSMATSGDYMNYFEENGVRYSHLIDPVAAKPISHNLASVTVLHPSCMMADGFATAINVLGPEQGMALAERENLPIMMIIREGEGFVEKMNDAFRLIREKTEESGN
nr:FAD:protein FMN transferase [Calditrichia bacterium]